MTLYLPFLWLLDLAFWLPSNDQGEFLFVTSWAAQKSLLSSLVTFGNLRNLRHSDDHPQAILWSVRKLTFILFKIDERRSVNQIHNLFYFFIRQTIMSETRKGSQQSYIITLTIMVLVTMYRLADKVKLICECNSVTLK